MAAVRNDQVNALLQIAQNANPGNAFRTVHDSGHGKTTLQSVKCQRAGAALLVEVLVKSSLSKTMQASPSTPHLALLLKAPRSKMSGFVLMAHGSDKVRATPFRLHHGELA
jgi:hypothetical protein